MKWDHKIFWRFLLFKMIRRFALFQEKPAFKIYVLSTLIVHTHSHTGEARSKLFLYEVVENQDHL